MTIAVCYFSKSGNTRKVTEAVGDAIGVKARDLSWPFDRKMDVVFLGSGVYAGGVDEQVKNFLTGSIDLQEPGLMSGLLSLRNFFVIMPV